MCSKDGARWSRSQNARFTRLHSRMSRHPTHSVEPGSVAQPHTRQLERAELSRIEEAMSERIRRARFVPGVHIRLSHSAPRPWMGAVEGMERACFPLVRDVWAFRTEISEDPRLACWADTSRHRSVTVKPSRGTRGAGARP